MIGAIFLRKEGCAVRSDQEEGGGLKKAYSPAIPMAPMVAISVNSTRQNRERKNSEVVAAAGNPRRHSAHVWRFI